MDSHLPPGNPRHLHALVGPSMAFVFLVSLISFLVHHWCPDAKGKSQEEEASASGQSGEGRGQCTGLCSRQDPDTELSFFPPSLPPFLLYLAALSLHCSTGELGCIMWNLSSWYLGSLAWCTGLTAPKACGILVPGPGMEPASPALRGGFLTTGLQGTPRIELSRENISGLAPPLSLQVVAYFSTGPVQPVISREGINIR